MRHLKSTYDGDYPECVDLDDKMHDLELTEDRTDVTCPRCKHAIEWFEEVKQRDEDEG